MIRRRPAPGHVIVQNNRTGRVSYWQKEFHQSAADENGISTADYIHAIYSFLRQAKCRDVLMIGCGGGTLANMLRRARVNVTVVDNNPLSFEIARSYFNFPQDAQTHIADGAAYLRRTRHRFDAIVLDAFSKGGMPKKFGREAFFKLAKSRMKPRGALFLMNIIVDDDDDPAPDRLARKAQSAWKQVRLLDTDGWVDRNAVLAAGAAARLKRPKLLLRPKSGAAKLKRELKILDFRPLR